MAGSDSIFKSSILEVVWFFSMVYKTATLRIFLSQCSDIYNSYLKATNTASHCQRQSAPVVAWYVRLVLQWYDFERLVQAVRLQKTTGLDTSLTVLTNSQPNSIKITVLCWIVKIINQCFITVLVGFHCLILNTFIYTPLEGEQINWWNIKLIDHLF